MLDKQPGVRLVGVGEIWRRLFANILLNVTVPESAMACPGYQLCAKLKAVIDGAVRRVQDLWDENSTTGDWGGVLLDANNSFNGINRIGILWTVYHL